MIQLISHLLPNTYNQTDRIQGMARYMNRDGASSEWMNLLLIFAGMLAVILVLKMIAAHSQKKREKAIRLKLAQKKASQAKNAQARPRPTGKPRGKATRLR